MPLRYVFPTEQPAIHPDNGRNYPLHYELQTYIRFVYIKQGKFRLGYDGLGLMQHKLTASDIMASVASRAASHLPRLTSPPLAGCVRWEAATSQPH